MLGHPTLFLLTRGTTCLPQCDVRAQLCRLNGRLPCRLQWTTASAATAPAASAGHRQQQPASRRAQQAAGRTAQRGSCGNKSSSGKAGEVLQQVPRTPPDDPAERQKWLNRWWARQRVLKARRQKMQEQGLDRLAGTSQNDGAFKLLPPQAGVQPGPALPSAAAAAAAAAAATAARLDGTTAQAAATRQQQQSKRAQTKTGDQRKGRQGRPPSARSLLAQKPATMELAQEPEQEQQQRQAELAGAAADSEQQAVVLQETVDDVQQQLQKAGPQVKAERRGRSPQQQWQQQQQQGQEQQQEQAQQAMSAAEAPPTPAQAYTEGALTFLMRMSLSAEEAEQALRQAFLASAELAEVTAGTDSGGDGDGDGGASLPPLPPPIDATRVAGACQALADIIGLKPAQLPQAVISAPGILAATPEGMAAQVASLATVWRGEGEVLAHARRYPGMLSPAFPAQVSRAMAALSSLGFSREQVVRAVVALPEVTQQT